MKRMIFTTLLLLGMAIAVVAQEQVTVSRFQGKRITGVKVGGAFKIKIRQGDNTGATLDIPARYEKLLVFSLDGDGELKIGFNGDIKGKKDDRFTAEITCSSLENLDLSGACELVGKGDFSASELSVEVSGAANVRAEGNILVSGRLDAELSGASRFFINNIRVAEIDINISGASRLDLKGTAEHGKIKVFGASNIEMGDFVLTNLAVLSSGASRMKINATEHLNISASGASNINYRGEAKLIVNISGAVSLKQF